VSGSITAAHEAARSVANLSAQLKAHALAGLMDLFVAVKTAEEQVKIIRNNAAAAGECSVETAPRATEVHPTQILPSHLAESNTSSFEAQDEAQLNFDKLVALYVEHRNKCLCFGLTSEEILIEALRTMRDMCGTNITNIPPAIPRTEPFVGETFEAQLASHGMDALEHGLVSTRLVRVPVVASASAANQLLGSTSASSNMLVCEDGLRLRTPGLGTKRSQKSGCFCLFSRDRHNHGSTWTNVHVKLSQKKLLVEHNDEVESGRQASITIDMHRHFNVVRTERACEDEHGFRSEESNAVLYLLTLQEKHFPSEYDSEEDLDDGVISDDVQLSDVITLSSRYACVIDIWEKGLCNVIDSFYRE
jgi:hypothetical protein